jgi:NADH-quinone oxidoreductase subunit M
MNPFTPAYLSAPNSPLLSVLVFLPLIGAVLLMLFPRNETRVIRGFALVVSLIALAVSLVLVVRYAPAGGAVFAFKQRIDWLPVVGAVYHLGVDGVALSLVVLTTLLTPIVILAAFSQVTDRVREYMISMLVLEAGMLGALCALDLVVFFIFWEVMLVPMYFLIGVWGGDRRHYAAVKFVLFTVAGSVLMLLAMLYLYFESGARSFDLALLLGKDAIAPGKQWLPFLAFALAFAIKVPMVPFHTWLPDAHTEAPTGGSVILAGVLLKMGVYGFYRFAMPLMPDAAKQAAPALAALAVIGIVYGALLAMTQRDLKKLVAYSSVSHLGFVMLGLVALEPKAVTGAALQMINHGLSTGALFLIVGLLYERTHTRKMSDYGGLFKVTPGIAVVFLITVLSSAALPGLNGFVGEFLILSGSFASTGIAGIQAWTGVATLGVVLGAAYLLIAYQRTMFGPVNDKVAQLRDLTPREIVYLAPIVVLFFAIGVFPRPLLARLEPSVKAFTALVEKRSRSGVAAAPGADVKIAVAGGAKAAAPVGAPGQPKLIQRVPRPAFIPVQPPSPLARPPSPKALERR